MVTDSGAWWGGVRAEVMDGVRTMRDVGGAGLDDVFEVVGGGWTWAWAWEMREGRKAWVRVKG